MYVRLLKNEDYDLCMRYLSPHQEYCMFMCSNLHAAGIEYSGESYSGEYFGVFSPDLVGVVVHYWNGNIMMYCDSIIALNFILEHVRGLFSRPIGGILGPDEQVRVTLEKFELLSRDFRCNRCEGLYALNLESFTYPPLADNLKIVPAQLMDYHLLIEWMVDYQIEALGATRTATLRNEVEEQWKLRLEKKDSWILYSDDYPVAVSGFNARIPGLVQVGPVYTPPAYRNQKFARILLAETLKIEKEHHTKAAILFTDNPAAARAYLSLGFEQIGLYRLAILQNSV
ncbi:MAG: GNAT family N-acetyltransferase [Gammaproteobacteria bacterium]|nr:GNAT family N-acetyltransferase [Gammaproteobacteria bacterium]